jgi:hypothetical protein
LIAMVNELLGAQMTELTDKADLLKRSGYRYHFERMIYRNRETKRAFSIEFVEDHSLQEIQNLLEAPATNDWVFHFNQPPPEEIKKELAEALEK